MSASTAGIHAVVCGSDRAEREARTDIDSEGAHGRAGGELCLRASALGTFGWVVERTLA
jgi:hypothetical protein